MRDIRLVKVLWILPLESMGEIAYKYSDGYGWRWGELIQVVLALNDDFQVVATAHFGSQGIVHGHAAALSFVIEAEVYQALSTEVHVQGEGQGGK